MAYLCRDCSYRGKRAGQSGSCPACGSFNLALEATAQDQEAPPPGRLRLGLLVGSWGVFLVLVVWKLLS